MLTLYQNRNKRCISRGASIISVIICPVRVGEYLEKKYLKLRSLKYMIARKFLMDLNKEFSRENNKTMKVRESKKAEQRSKIIEKFVQEFKRAVRESGYKGRPLIEKFKQEINGVIRRKLMEVEFSPRNIEQ